MQLTRPDGSVHTSNYWGHGAVGGPAILLRWHIIVGANSFRQLQLEMTVGGPHYTDPLLIKQLAAFHHLVRVVNALVYSLAVHGMVLVRKADVAGCLALS